MPPTTSKSLTWLLCPKVKVFEAIGALADDRLTLNEFPSVTWSSPPEVLTEVHKMFAETQKVMSFVSLSSNKDKRYSVRVAPSETPGRISVFCNDNGSLFQNYLGYPAIAALMLIGAVGRTLTPPERADLDVSIKCLRGVKWKEIASFRKNKWDLVVDDVMQLHVKSVEERVIVQRSVDVIFDEISKLVAQGAFVKFSSSSSSGVKRERDDPQQISA